MPNVSRKQLLRSIRGEKDPVARDRMLACLHRKDGCSIRRICKIMVRPYSTVRYTLRSSGMEPRVDFMRN